MSPELLGKNDRKSPWKLRAPLLALAVGLALGLALATGACVSSTEPILSDARAILGEGGQLHLFDVQEDGDRNPADLSLPMGRPTATPRRGRPAEASDFTVHPYEGRDLIVQAQRTAAGPRRTGMRPSTALARKLADGVYLMTADRSQRRRRGHAQPLLHQVAATRPAGSRRRSSCSLFARATAAKEDPNGASSPCWCGQESVEAWGERSNADDRARIDLRHRDRGLHHDARGERQSRWCRGRSASAIARRRQRRRAIPTDRGRMPRTPPG